MNSYNVYYQNIRMSYSNGSYFIPMSDLGNGPASYGREWTTKPRYRPGQVVRTKTRQPYIHLPGGGFGPDGGEEEEYVTEGDDESVARRANAAYSDDDEDEYEDADGGDGGEEGSSSGDTEVVVSGDEEEDLVEEEDGFEGEDVVEGNGMSRKSFEEGIYNYDEEMQDTASVFSQETEADYEKKRTSGAIYEQAIRGKYPCPRPARA